MNRDETIDRYVRPRRSKLWALWRICFPGADMAQCVIAWRGAIYIPTGRGAHELGPDVAVHEAHHLKQQLRYGSSFMWWIKYRLSRKFRLQEELEAYRTQYLYGSRIIPDFKGRTIYLRELAEGMAGPTYGLGITIPQAMDLIYPKK